MEKELNNNIDKKMKEGEKHITKQKNTKMQY